MTPALVLLRPLASGRRLPLDPPLDPGADEARSRLRRELLRPEYHDQNVLERVLRWFERRVQDGVEAAGSSHPLSVLAAMVVALLLLGALGWLVSRARATARAAEPARPLLTDEAVPAAELRARAEAAFTDGRYADAVVDGYRALATRQVERGRIDDVPGLTAHEVAVALARELPDRRADLVAGAALFDAVLYGDRPAGRDQAAGVLALDDSLAGAR